MAGSRVRSRGMDLCRQSSEKIDLDSIQEDYESDMEESERLQEAGDQYEADKGMIEMMLESVMDSELSDEDKADVLKALRADLETVKEGFQEVAEQQDEIDERQQERMEMVDDAMATYQEEMAELEKQAEEIEIASVDFQESIDAAQERVDAFEGFAEEATEAYNEVRQTALEQRARMLGN